MTTQRPQAAVPPPIRHPRAPRILVIAALGLHLLAAVGLGAYDLLMRHVASQEESLTAMLGEDVSEGDRRQLIQERQDTWATAGVLLLPYGCGREGCSSEGQAFSTSSPSTLLLPDTDSSPPSPAPSWLATARLGPACVRDAIAPLIEQEARQGLPGWTLAVAMDAVQSTAAARGTLAPRTMALALLIPAAVLALLWFLLYRARDYAARPFALPQNRGGTDEQLDRHLTAQEKLESAVAEFEAVEASAHEAAEAAPQPKIAWQHSVPMWGGVLRRREQRAAASEAEARNKTVEEARARMLLARAAEKGASEALQAARGAVARAEARAITQHDGRLQRGRALHRWAPAPAAACLVLSLLGVLGVLRIPDSQAPLSIRPDTALHAALTSGGEYAAAFAKQCGLTLLPTMEASATTALDAGVMLPSREVAPENSGAVLVGGGPICTRGQRCGGTCIPLGRICALDRPKVATGMACGQGWISAAKTCRIDLAPTREPVSYTVPIRSQPSAPAVEPPPPSSTPFFSAPSGGSYLPTPAPSPRQSGAVPSAPREVHVAPYTRADGTEVRGYNRTAPNSSRDDNYSRRGNTNPHTGARGSR